MKKNGYNVFLNTETKVLENLDKDFMMFTKEYSVNKWNTPALISGDVLERCGYFDTIPHQLTTVGWINCGNKVDSSYNNNIETSNMFLIPAACIHFYPMLEKVKIKNQLITTKTRVYRYEDGTFEDEIRLWDFTVREFVAVGDEQFVKNFLDDFKNKLVNYAKKYTSNINLVVANDHFYPTKENKLKERVQKNSKMKYELLVKVDNKEFAIASFNYHGNHFSKEFNFDDNGTIVTGCVGCGFERWLHLLKGVNEKNE